MEDRMTGGDVQREDAVETEMRLRASLRELWDALLPHDVTDDPIGWVLAEDLPAQPWSTVFVDPDMDGAVPVYVRPVVSGRQFQNEETT